MHAVDIPSSHRHLSQCQRLVSTEATCLLTSGQKRKSGDRWRRLLYTSQSSISNRHNRLASFNDRIANTFAVTVPLANDNGMRLTNCWHAMRLILIGLGLAFCKHAPRNISHAAINHLIFTTGVVACCIFFRRRSVGLYARVYMST